LLIGDADDLWDAAARGAVAVLEEGDELGVAAERQTRDRMAGRSRIDQCQYGGGLCLLW
jgi:hypothetical protein